MNRRERRLFGAAGDGGSGRRVLISSFLFALFSPEGEIQKVNQWKVERQHFILRENTNKIEESETSSDYLIIFIVDVCYE